MGLLQRDGIERLRHVCKFSRQHSTICTTLVDAGWMAGVGKMLGPDPREFAESDLIVCWGANPAATQVNLMSHIATARKTRGAKLVVIDPYRGATAAVADRHLCLRPGTDGALACAVIHASPFKHMQRGVVIIESVWPNDAYEEGMGVNALIGADAAPPPGRRRVPRRGGLAAGSVISAIPAQREQAGNRLTTNQQSLFLNKYPHMTFVLY